MMADDSAAVAIQNNDELSEQSVIENRIDTFVRTMQKRSEQKTDKRSTTLHDLINDAPIISDEMIDVFFDNDTANVISVNAISELRRILAGMQKKINSLPDAKRLFTLETIDFFHNKLSVNRLVPTLFALKGEAQKKAICELVFPTLFSINRNVEILANESKLFSSQKLHVERGLLYVFIKDISDLLLMLFNRTFKNENDQYSSSIEFLVNTFDSKTFLINPNTKSNHKYIFSEIIDDESLLRRIVLKFILLIQSHKAVYMYAVKRHMYYKLYLLDLTNKNRFGNAKPFEISKLLAGCLLSNDQLVPPEELIDGMLDESEFDSQETIKLKRAFVDDLSPKQVFKIISRFQKGMQIIYKRSFNDEFFEFQKFSFRNVLKNVWKGVMTVVEKSIKTMEDLAQPAVAVFQKFLNAYQSFVRTEEEETKEIKRTVEGKKVSTIKPVSKHQPKNVESFAIMSQHFTNVKTDIAAFRGEMGASINDHSVHQAVFNKSEELQQYFDYAFKRLAELLKSKGNVKFTNYEKLSRIKEFDIAYKFGNYLLCFGVTHVAKGDKVYIDEKDLFPYALLFEEGKRKIQKNIRSRSIVYRGRIKIFNAVDLDENSMVIIHEALYLIMHLLPEASWSLKSTQICIDFLVKSLRRAKKTKKDLLYCVNIPEQVN